MIWLAWHNDNTSQRAVRCTKAEIISHFAGLTKEFPVSSAQPGWERFWRGLRGPTPLTADPVAPSTPAKPTSHKWNQSFVRGEWSRFTADGLLTKSHTTVWDQDWTGISCSNFRACFTQPLMQTQLLLSLSIHAPLRCLSAPTERYHVHCSGC